MSLLGGSLWAEVESVIDHHKFCCSIRTMFSVTCGLSCFLSIFVGHLCLCCFYFLQQIFILYLLYLISKGFFHLGGLISRTHTNVYMSFTEWECFCFSSLLNTILGLWIFNVYSKYFVTECDWLNSAVKRTCVLEYLHRKSISGALICNTACYIGYFSSCVLGVSCGHGSMDACKPGFILLTTDWWLC